MHTSKHRDETGLMPAGHYFDRLSKALRQSNERYASQLTFDAAEEWTRTPGSLRRTARRRDAAPRAS